MVLFNVPSCCRRITCCYEDQWRFDTAAEICIRQRLHYPKTYLNVPKKNNSCNWTLVQQSRSQQNRSALKRACVKSREDPEVELTEKSSARRRLESPTQGALLFIGIKHRTVAMGSELEWNPLVKFHAKHGLAKKNAREQFLTALLNLALQAGVGPAILIYLNFDSAVLGSPLCGRVRSDRFGFSKSLT